MYSLVSAPVLGFDLARLEGGPATAEVLLAALALAPEDLPVLAQRLPDDSLRAELWQDVDAAALRMQTVTGVATAAGDAPGAVALLERAPIGSLDALLRCVRHDVLDWTWDTIDGPRTQRETAARATALVCDALVASYLREELSAPVRRRLAAGWVAASRRIPVRPSDLGPNGKPVARLIDRFRGLTGGDVDRLVQAVERSRKNSAGWAPAMHSASWAVYLSGRIRAAAAAQLLLVRAVDSAGVGMADRAGGVWNALSGAVHALVVRDLLDSATTQELVEPTLVALGPTALL